MITPVDPDSASPAPVDSIRLNMRQDAGPIMDRQAHPSGEEQRVPAPERREEEEPVRQDRPIPNEAPLPIAEQQPITPPDEPKAPSPNDVLPTNAPNDALAQTTPSPRAGAQHESTTAGQTLTAALRERVLDRPAETSPLDGEDAVAAVDLGLKAVGGAHAGLSVPRDGAGRSKGFNLRLGRNLAISASR